ncbi:NAC domain protein [Striga asiatica]|uniref:NAC domain protein n=1 Tax=Striga asiatica TaxID=4170 RepID=A0A5A7R6M6_STRAF|nr:NAC domain protein [Striga asiatica]
MSKDDVREIIRNIGSTNTCCSSKSLSMEISIAEASSKFPGFRFSPSDEELLQYYLKKKLQGSDESVEVIPEVDICKHEPWDLPAQSIIQSDSEWFFFSPRGRKYPNGSQSKRATQCGYWKATGKERNVKCGSYIIGTKRTLVFHLGRAPKGQRTEWIMHEYSTSEKSEDNAMVVCRIRKNQDFHLHETTKRNRAHNERSAEKNELVDSGGSSYSVEQVEIATDDESDDNKEGVDANELEHIATQSPHHHHELSSLKKSDAEEDDCYFDIMKDNIVELDENVEGLNTSKPDVGFNYAFQGTAHRRLRLRRERPKSEQTEQSHKIPIGIAKMLQEQRQEEMKAEQTESSKTEESYYRPYVMIMLMFVLVFVIGVMFWKGP